jgi:hypothetical protein
MISPKELGLMINRRRGGGMIILKEIAFQSVTRGRLPSSKNPPRLLQAARPVISRTTSSSPQSSGQQ